MSWSMRKPTRSYYAAGEDSGQPVQPYSLIQVFTWCTVRRTGNLAGARKKHQNDLCSQ